MPYRVTLRSTATLELNAPPVEIVNGEKTYRSLEEFHAAIASQVPDGYELVSVTQGTGTGLARSTEVSETTVDSRDDVWTCAGDGWQALGFRPIG